MPFMTRIPYDLARFGLKVELVPGWESRGSSSFAPAGVVDHWTAGPRGTTGRPSLNVVVNGRAGLSGPLCNVYLARDGVCVVVAAGRANHAGEGGFRGLVGNSAVYGIEAECGGDGDWTPEMLDAYPRLNAALLSGIGRDASWVCGHNEWAPTRKIDIRDIIASVRANTARALAGGLPPQEDELSAAEVKQINDWTTNVRDQLSSWMRSEIRTQVTERVIAADARVAALQEVVKQLAAKQGTSIDMNAIGERVEQAVADAIESIETTVRLDTKPPVD